MKDPWAQSLAQGRNSKSGSKKHEEKLVNKRSKNEVDIPDILEHDRRAMAIAAQLMAVNVRECSNRQVAAANTSALFNLVLHSGHKPRTQEAQSGSENDSPIVPNPTVSTGQLAQDAFSRHYGHSGFSTLAGCLREYRRVLPPELAKKVRELNGAASYDRHHGAVINQELLDDLERTLQKLARPSFDGCASAGDDGDETRKDDDKLQHLVGKWENCEGQCITVVDNSLGYLVHIRDDEQHFTKIETDGDEIKLALGLYTWRANSISSQEVVWQQKEGDLIFVDGEMKHTDELRTITWKSRE